MLYLSLRDYIYPAYFGEQAVILDVKKNRYYVLTKQQSHTLQEVVSGKIFSENDTLYSDKHALVNKKKFSEISDLQKLSVIDTHLYKTTYPFFIHHQKTNEGMPNLDWRLPLDGIEGPLMSKEVFEALWILIKVNVKMKFNGFHSIIKKMQHSKQKGTTFRYPTSSEISRLCNALNAACLMYPMRTKCLEWSMALVLLFLKRFWQCNLVIGVQTYPFLAHAWVESTDGIIGDYTDLREKMCVLLEEPFRRGK